MPFEMELKGKVSEKLPFEQKPERIKEKAIQSPGEWRKLMLWPRGSPRLGEIKEHRSVWLQTVEGERRGESGFYFIVMGSHWRV